MSIMSLPFLMSAVIYFVLGVWIVMRHNSKSQRLYGTLCIVTCFWQGIWAALLSGLSEDNLFTGLRIGYTGIVFIPALFYHFIAEFTQRTTESKWLRTNYVVSSVFAVLIWTGPVFVAGFNRYSWGLAAKAGVLHPLFIAFISIVVFRMFYLLLKSREAEKQKLKRNQINWVLAALLIYSCGTLDLLSNYGLPVFPLSSVFAGVAFAFFSYAIFRYELLAIAAPTETDDERDRRIAASTEMIEQTGFRKVREWPNLGDVQNH